MKIGLVFQRILPPVWFGIVAAVALESYLKFQAPGITRELGLGIGKLVFTAVSWIEIALAVLLGIAIFLLPASRPARALFIVLAVLLLVQTFGVMPALMWRIDAIIGGQPPPASPIHMTYIVLEMIKLALLLALSVIVSWPRETR